MSETDWRPPVGTRVILLHPHPWAEHVGTVDAHEQWMGRPTMAVALDGLTTRAGVTQPGEFRRIDDL